MSSISPFASPYQQANPYARPNQGGIGRPPVRVQFVQDQPQAQAPKKGGFFKKLLIGAAVITAGGFALKHFSPDTFSKVAQSVQSKVPDSLSANATQGKTYIVEQGKKLAENSTVKAGIDWITNLLKKVTP